MIVENSCKLPAHDVDDGGGVLIYLAQEGRDVLNKCVPMR